MTPLMNYTTTLLLLINLQGNDSYKSRESATLALQAYGEHGQDIRYFLRAGIKSGDPEIAARSCRAYNLNVNALMKYYSKMDLPVTPIYEFVYSKDGKHTTKVIKRGVADFIDDKRSQYVPWDDDRILDELQVMARAKVTK